MQTYSFILVVQLTSGGITISKSRSHLAGILSFMGLELVGFGNGHAVEEVGISKFQIKHFWVKHLSVSDRLFN